MSTHPPVVQPLRTVRRLVWVAVLVLVLLGALLFAIARRSGHTAAAPPAPSAEAPVASWAAGMRPAPAFRLTDQSGLPVSLRQYRGRPVIVTFIDPLCRNFCPLEAKQLNELVRAMPAQSRPAIVSVSVNVYGNARANLVEDVTRWRLVPQWRWAVGSRAELARVWRQYQVGVLVTTKKIAGVTVHEVSHTEGAYVVDAHGNERALFLWPFRAADVRAALARAAS
jgi:cytochrome oxidase Cu insertion factor (SCO1/SenC/PrrC family)